MTPFPWEERQSDCISLIWRYSRNPIVGRYSIPTSNSIFNNAVVPFGDGYAGVFRCDNRRREMRLHAGFSDDGIAWNINHEPVSWILPSGVEQPEYGYDPRVVEIDGEFLVTWCNGFHGPAIAIGKTRDFQLFEVIENALLPCNRNGVLFPRKINGDYVMLSRPSDAGHTPFGEIFLNHSTDLVHWGRHRFVMGSSEPWESTKIGAGPAPIETPQGWLLFYHGVLTSCNGFVYHFGAALLDMDEPWKVIARGKSYLMSPQMPYEHIGDVPNVVFPCAALCDSDRIAIYYGCADTVIGLAFCRVSEILDFVREG